MCCLPRRLPRTRPRATAVAVLVPLGPLEYSLGSRRNGVICAASDLTRVRGVGGSVACASRYFITALTTPAPPPQMPRLPLSIGNGFEIMMRPAASTGAPSRPAYWHRGIGYDYAFADVVGENVVRVKCGAVEARQALCLSLEYKETDRKKTLGITGAQLVLLSKHSFQYHACEKPQRSEKVLKRLAEVEKGQAGCA